MSFQSHNTELLNQGKPPLTLTEYAAWRMQLEQDWNKAHGVLSQEEQDAKLAAVQKVEAQRAATQGDVSPPLDSPTLSIALPIFTIIGLSSSDNSGGSFGGGGCSWFMVSALARSLVPPFMVQLWDNPIPY